MQKLQNLVGRECGVNVRVEGGEGLSVQGQPGGRLRIWLDGHERVWKAYHEDGTAIFGCRSTQSR